MKIVLWIAVGLIALFIIVLAFALAKTAKRANEQVERDLAAAIAEYERAKEGGSDGEDTRNT